MRILSEHGWGWRSSDGGGSRETTFRAKVCLFSCSRISYLTSRFLTRHKITAPILGQDWIILPLTASSPQSTFSNEPSNINAASISESAKAIQDVLFIEDEDVIELAELGSLI
jgi:hypothetical protein